MKIVILNDMLWGGGRERRIVQLIAGLNRLGFEQITLVLLDERVDYPEVYDLKVNVVKIKRKNSRDFSVFPKLYRLLNEIRPDVVNPWSFMTTFYAAPISAVLGLKCIGAFVVDSKSPKLLSMNGVAKHIGFLLCSKIVANSQAGHKAYGTPKSKQVVIYNGFNEARLASSKSAERRISIREKPIISMIGRIDPQKDFRTYIDALKILKDRGIDFQAYIVGQGPMSEEIAKHARDECAGSVTLTGFLKDVDSHIRNADIGVLCTDPENHAEGVSNAILEFMAHGKPVVATDGGGTPEIIENGSSGFIVEPKDSLALAEYIVRLLNNPALMSDMGTRGREIVQEKFSLTAMAKGFKEVYCA